MHTPLSKHASGAPAEYRSAAAKRGMAEMCFTDHLPNYNGLGRDCTMEPEDYPKYRDMILGLQDGKGPLALFGAEADYVPGCIGPLEQWLGDKSLDMVIGSVHFIGDWPFDHPKHMDTWKSADINGVWKAYFSILKDAVETGIFDTVGHFDLPKKFGHRAPDRLVRELCRPVLDSVAKFGMAIEINTAGLRKPVAEIYPSPIILEQARERAIPVCFGSDAHAPEEVGADFDKALALAREVGYDTRAEFRKRQRTLLPLKT